MNSLCDSLIMATSSPAQVYERLGAAAIERFLNAAPLDVSLALPQPISHTRKIRGESDAKSINEFRAYQTELTTVYARLAANGEDVAKHLRLKHNTRQLRIIIARISRTRAEDPISASAMEGRLDHVEASDALALLLSAAAEPLEASGFVDLATIFGDDKADELRAREEELRERHVATTAARRASRQGPQTPEQYFKDMAPNCAICRFSGDDRGSDEHRKEKR